MQIIGGTGNNRPVGATNDNHMQTAARTLSSADAHTFAGLAFNFNTGVVTLTNSAVANGLGYLANRGTRDLAVTRVVFTPAASVGGAGAGLFEFLHNPKTGTVISEAEKADVSNRLIGSTTPPVGDFFKAAGSGKTLSEEEAKGIQAILAVPAGAFFFDVGVLVIGPGQSLGFRYTTQAGNTSQDVMIAALMYEVGLGT